MSQHRLDLAWTRTWKDRSHDFSAFDGELLVGRVYRLLGGPAGGHWQWNMSQSGLDQAKAPRLSVAENER